MVEGKEADAVRHLAAHAAKPHKLCPGRGIVHPLQGLQVHLISKDHFHGLSDIPAPVAQAPGPQVRLRGLGQLPRAGERIVDLPLIGNAPPAIPLCQELHIPSDTPDVVLLGDDEGDDHLPQVLPEDADAPSKIRRPDKVGVRRVYPLLVRPVIFLQVKIGAPEIPQLLFPAVKPEGVRFFRLFYFQVPVPGHKLPDPFFYLLHAEALAGGEDLPRGKMLFCNCYHGLPLLSLFCLFMILQVKGGFCNPKSRCAVALRAYRTKKAPENSDALFVYLSVSMSKWLMPHFFRGHLCRGRRFPVFQNRLLPAHILSASAWPPGLSSWEPGSGPSHSGRRVQPGPS